MSCSDASSAQNVANKLGGNANITAWDGKVTVFENGTISGEGVCRQFTPGNNSRILTDAETPKGTNAGKNGIGITLGVNGAGSWQRILTKLDNIEIPNLKSKLNTFDDATKTRFADDVANLSDEALKQLEDNFGLLDEWKQIDALSVSAQASKKPVWLQKILDDNEFNRIRSSSYPNNEVYLINPNDPSKYVRLDSYKPGQEIVSRKYTQFRDIQESTGVKYIQELKDKYPPGTKIVNVPSNKTGGANSSLQNYIGTGIDGK